MSAPRISIWRDNITRSLSIKHIAALDVHMEVYAFNVFMWEGL